MRRNILLFTLMCAFLAIASQVGGVPLNADELNEGASYVGEKSCKKCHLKVHRGWKKRPHAEAWENLPAKYHDPAQKDEDGRACISCHVTGWGHGDVGGFVDVEKSGHLLGVQCESCHGPGSKHIDAAKAIMKERRKEFNADEKTYIVAKTKACSDCHNPHIDYKKFAEGG